MGDQSVMTRAEEDAATEAFVALGKAIIPAYAAADPTLARWLYMGGHLDLLRPEDLAWARSVTDPEDRPDEDKEEGERA